MSGISDSNYIRWVKGSLNRLFGCQLPDNANTSPDYRMWVLVLQTNQKLAITSKVDRAEQDALIKLNRWIPEYIRWIQVGLNLSGEGVGPGGKGLCTDGIWGENTEDSVKAFQINHEGKLVDDGWVGAKTETLLMARTGTIPPGRIGGKIVTPVPGVWDNLLSEQDWGEVLAGMYKAQIGFGGSVRDKQLSCFLGKLSSLMFEKNFRYLSNIDVQHCEAGRFGEVYNETLGQYVERFARSNVRSEVLSAIRPFLRIKSTAEILKEYKKQVDKSFERVMDGLVAIQRKYAWDIREAHDLRANGMHSWATKLQQDPRHIYSCFQVLE